MQTASRGKRLLCLEQPVGERGDDIGPQLELALDAGSRDLDRLDRPFSAHPAR